MYRRQLAFVVCLVLATITTEAQVVTATLNGNVTDSSGGAIPGATVTATQQGTSVVRTTTTNGEGNYNVPYLSPGNYKVTIEAPGFKRFTRDDIALNVSTVVRVDSILTPGNITETVEVTGALAAAAD